MEIHGNRINAQYQGIGAEGIFRFARARPGVLDAVQRVKDNKGGLFTKFGNRVEVEEVFMSASRINCPVQVEQFNPVKG